MTSTAVASDSARRSSPHDHPRLPTIPRHSTRGMPMRYMSMIRLGLAAALIGLAAPAPAHAQFGKLMKKAKHAMDPAKSDSARGTAADDASMRRPAGMVELTSARVGGLIDGLQAMLHLV